MLTKCQTLFGGARIEPGSPEVVRRTNVMVRHHALYDVNRALVPESALMREFGPLSFPGNSSTSDHNPARPKRIINEPVYWVGQFHTHFGHYLISLLPRLWAKSDYPFQIGFTGNTTAAEFFRKPFVIATLNSLGLSERDFIHLDDFDLLREVVIPSSTFHENSVVYERFRTLTQGIAASLRRPDTESHSQAKAIYFSKEGLAAGVSKIANEAAVSAILMKEGVQIVRPEELSFLEQLSIWQSNDTFVSYASSALHMAAFVQNKQIISLCHSNTAESNQVLINEVCGHTGAYLHTVDGVDFLPAGNGFHFWINLKDPEAVAAGLLQAIGNMERNPGNMRMLPRPKTDTVSRILFPNEPFGRNVALGKIARISSSDPNWQTESADRDAEQAVGGALSDSFQFHTLNEQSPWWTVDLGGRFVVNEVRIFNRHDRCWERAARIQILFSDNGGEWELVHQRLDAGHFGGLNDEPYRWLPNNWPSTRHVRLQLPGHDMLHLNQIEIFGYPDDKL